jgi:hypothetical protein
MVKLTADDGTSVELEPDILLDQGVLAVTIPADTAAGNYRVQATKGDMESNPTVISITPDVEVSGVSIRRGRATIYGSGFGGYAEGSGTEVNGTFVERIGRRSRTYSMKGEVLSWTDSEITVRFPELPRTVTVESVFGSDRYVVVSN